MRCKITFNHEVTIVRGIIIKSYETTCQNGIWPFSGRRGVGVRRNVQAKGFINLVGQQCHEVQDFVSGTARDMVTSIYPSAESIKKLRQHGYIVTAKTGIKIRMLKIGLPSGETEVLLTNLFNQEIFTFKKLSTLYRMRWNIETAYSRQKNQLQLEICSGHRVVCVEQDYAAGLFVSNLQSIIEKQCEQDVRQISLARLHAYKINKNISWALLKNRILKIFIQPIGCTTILLERQYLFVRNIEPVRPDRHYERTSPKRKRGKYQTFTNYRRAI
jgi:hypothetical protein